MPITRFPHQERIYKKKQSHQKNDSGELDVFEAAWYFTGTNEGCEFYGSNHSHKAMREEKKAWGGRRMSIDMPMRNPLPSQVHQVEKQLKEKKYKQPSSPGGKLAKLLNSIFSHAASKKKKSKSTTQSVIDEESPGGRRRRRSSVSHFRSASTPDSKSIYLSSSSGFRTPPPYADTTTKAYKDMLSYSDHQKQVVPLSKHNGQVRSSMGLQHELLDEKRNMDLAWLDEKFKFYNGFSEKNKNYNGCGSLEKDRKWVDDYTSDKKFRKFEEVDDGGESDSSSDLFELQNCDLGFYSSGLPVYETTHMESIKRGAPIANGTR